MRPYPALDRVPALGKLTHVKSFQGWSGLEIGWVPIIFKITIKRHRGSHKVAIQSWTCAHIRPKTGGGSINAQIGWCEFAEAT